MKRIDCENYINKTIVSENNQRKHRNVNNCEHEAGNNKEKKHLDNRTLIVGPYFCGKTYLIMKKFLASEPQTPDRIV